MSLHERPAVQLAKRQRIARACDQCRASKHRCNGQQPVCGPCIDASRECTYRTSTKRRGLPPGYVRSLEFVLGLIMTRVPNGPCVVDTLVEHLGFPLDLDTTRQAWTSSQLQSKLERHMTNLEGGSLNPPVQDTLACQFEVPHLESTRPITAPPDAPGLEHGTAELGIDLPENSRELVDLYISTTHCWFPIIEKSTLFELLYSHSKTNHERPGANCALWAIMAYVSALQRPSATPMRLCSQKLSITAYSECRKLLPTEEQTSFEIGHAQAFLLLALFKLHHGQLLAAYLLVGQAVRVTLWLRKEAPDLSTFSIDRLFHGCFALDTLISSVLDVPAHLRASDVHHLPGPLVETGSDEWEPSHQSPNLLSGGPLRAISTFNQFLGIVRLLNHMIHSPDASQCTNVKDWHSQLPEHCALPDKLYDTIQLPSQLINLHVAAAVTAYLSGSSLPPPGPSSPMTRIRLLLEKFRSEPGHSAVPPIFLCYSRHCAGKIDFESHGVAALNQPCQATRDIPTPCDTGQQPKRTVGGTSVHESLNSNTSYLEDLTDTGPYSTEGVLFLQQERSTRQYSAVDLAQSALVENGLIGGILDCGSTPWLDTPSSQFMHNLGFSTPPLGLQSEQDCQNAVPDCDRENGIHENGEQPT